MPSGIFMNERNLICTSWNWRLLLPLMWLQSYIIFWAPTYTRVEASDVVDMYIYCVLYYSITNNGFESKQAKSTRTNAPTHMHSSAYGFILWRPPTKHCCGVILVCWQSRQMSLSPCLLWWHTFSVEQSGDAHFCHGASAGIFSHYL